MPKGSQNEATIDTKNPSKINTKTGNGKDHTNHKNNVYLNGKNIEIHCKHKCF